MQVLPQELDNDYLRLVMKELFLHGFLKTAVLPQTQEAINNTEVIAQILLLTPIYLSLGNFSIYEKLSEVYYRKNAWIILLFNYFRSKL